MHDDTGHHCTGQRIALTNSSPPWKRIRSGAFLIVDDDGACIGIVAQADIATLESARKTGELVSHISAKCEGRCGKVSSRVESAGFHARLPEEAVTDAARWSTDR